MSISDHCTVHTAQLSVLGVRNLEVDVDCTQHDRSVTDQCLVFKLGVVMTEHARSDTGNDAKVEKGKNLGERMCRFLSSQIGCGPVAWLPNTTTHLACFISSLAPASSQIASFNRSHVVIVTHRKNWQVHIWSEVLWVISKKEKLQQQSFSVNSALLYLCPAKTYNLFISLCCKYDLCTSRGQLVGWIHSRGLSFLNKGTVQPLPLQASQLNGRESGWTVGGGE